jgi:hypothetical protein
MAGACFYFTVLDAPDFFSQHPWSCRNDLHLKAAGNTYRNRSSDPSSKINACSRDDYQGFVHLRLLAFLLKGTLRIVDGITAGLGLRSEICQ